MLKIPSALSGPLLYRYIYIYSGKRQDFGRVQVHFIGSRLEQGEGSGEGEWGHIRNTRDRACLPRAGSLSPVAADVGGLGRHLAPEIQ